LCYNEDGELSFISKPNRYSSFEITILSENTLTISYRLGYELYYLMYSNGNFYFDRNFNYVYALFYFTKNKNTYYLYKKLNQVFYVVGINSQTSLLSINVDLKNYKNYPCLLNYYIQDLKPDLNTSWCSYNTLYKNSLLVNDKKSISNLTNNNLIYSNYTYITGDSIEANFLTLKNQNTIKNYSYRADNLNNSNPNIPNVMMRNYTSLNTGNKQELGNDCITLTFETYNTDYIFKSDSFTKFKVPQNIYPFSQLNINDSQFLKSGAIAGENPYFSDKVYFKDQRPGKQDGKYLCTWLSGGSENAIWVDRYYVPQDYEGAKNSETESSIYADDRISSYLDKELKSSEYYTNFNWHDSPESEAEYSPQKIKDAIWGEYFFDKISDLILLPEGEYVYQRIGDAYISKLLNGLADSLISNGLSGFKRTDGFEYTFEEDIDDIIYEFKGQQYNMIEEYRNVNLNSEFTVTFAMNSDNWKAGFGHCVMGSYNDRGFGIFSDEKVTPFVMVQNGRSINILNTNFDVIDTVYLSQDELDMKAILKTTSTDTQTTSTISITSFFVKDVIRTDHLDIFMPSVAKNTYTIVNSEIKAEPQDCGILYADEEDLLRAISPDNVTVKGTPIQKIQIEQCFISDLFKTR
jgi:hypothetical protein